MMSTFVRTFKQYFRGRINQAAQKGPVAKMKKSKMKYLAERAGCLTERLSLLKVLDEGKKREGISGKGAGEVIVGNTYRALTEAVSRWRLTVLKPEYP